MTASGLASSRFAVARLSEALDGLRALSDPRQNQHLRSWVRWARPRLRGLDLSLLDALVRTGGYAPDFLTPPPAPSQRPLEAELADVRATPADRVHMELELAFRGRPLPARVNVALADGEQVFLMRVAEALVRFWYAAMEPWWPATRAVLEDDIAYRGRLLTRHGAAVALGQMDRTMRWEDSCLEIAAPTTVDADWASDGVILSPSLFGGPRVYYILQPWNQTVIFYPARNVLNDRAPWPNDEGRGTIELIGHTRAMILAQLDQPRSTTELAARLGLSPSTVSHHLGVLHRAGLLDRSRDGREVLYSRV
jgi:DNA-binding transcriptional ArsR family regulator